MSIPDPDHAEETDGLSVRLSSQPLPALPEHWRAEILAAAWRAAPLAERKPRWVGWLVMSMWPHPWAYAALASVWLLTLALQWSTPAAETSGRRITAAEVAASDDPLAVERTRLAINTVLSASFRHPEARP